MIGEMKEKEVTCKNKIQPILCDNCGAEMGKNFEIVIGEISLKKCKTDEDNIKFTINTGGGCFDDERIEGVGYICSECRGKLRKDFNEMVAELLKKYKLEDRAKRAMKANISQTTCSVDHLKEEIKKDIMKDIKGEK
jgi:hypothetical protein